MVLSAIRLALNDDAKTDVNKLLFSTGDHNNVTVNQLWEQEEHLGTSHLPPNLAQLSVCGTGRH